MKAIGGYFELADYEEGVFPYMDGIMLNTGRNALEFILRSLGDVKRIYLPYFTCDAVLEPINKLNIPYTFYHISFRFEILDEIQPNDGEYIIANNYFGIKDAYIESLAEKYGKHLIVDCAQAFFARPISGIKTFYSTRKYVGVSDGGVAYLGALPDDRVKIKETDRSDVHNNHLLKRKIFGAEAGFAYYQANEKKMANQPVRWMSCETKQILEHINYDKVVARRRENFQYLHYVLGGMNVLSLPESDTYACPMVYPYFTNDKTLRQRLVEEKIYVATYWPNVEYVAGFDIEYDLSSSIVPVPCDQRYGKNEMNRIIDIVKQQ